LKATLERPGRGRDFLKVGVTGGIGSGKSTVCGLFQRLGRTVISADRIAREITEQNETVQRRIASKFGRDVFLADGSLNRRRLADRVFAESGLRRTLDSIVHPHVFAAIDKLVNSLPPGQRIPYVVIEAALIFETGMDRQLDYTIVVHADEKTRIARTLRRDRCSRVDILNRIHSQMPAAQKRRKADFVIENDGAERELPEKVAFLDRLLGLLVTSRPVRPENGRQKQRQKPRS
jgi:dephospho-CoA kinase